MRSLILLAALGLGSVAPHAQTLEPTPLVPDTPFLSAMSAGAAPARPSAACTTGQRITQDVATSAFGIGNAIVRANGAVAPQELGQSFTAPCGGVLDSLTFVFQPSPMTAGTTFNATFAVYGGAGTAGAVIESQPLSFTVPNEGFAYDFPLNIGDLTVVEGQVYTYFIDVLDGTISLQGATPSPYAGGAMYFSNSGSATPSSIQATFDLRFFAVFKPSTVVAAEGAPSSARVALKAPAPNPTASSTSLAFSLASASDVRLAVLDALGREVAVVADRAFGAGDQSATFSTAGLAPGVYVVVLQAGGERVTQRLSVVR